MGDGDGAAARELERLFNRVFFDRWKTRLLGGAEEPLYLPAGDDCDHHRVIYREDYFASAMHEGAHWCIAGERRRQLGDFGYWYHPDGRSPEQQQAFEQVEVKPQALEWMFMVAAGRRFRLSADNLSAEEPVCRGPSRAFAERVTAQARQWSRRDGMPSRGEQFVLALADFYGAPDPFDATHYQDMPL